MGNGWCGTSFDYTECFDRFDFRLGIAILTWLGLAGYIASMLLGLYTRLQRLWKFKQATEGLFKAFYRHIAGMCVIGFTLQWHHASLGPKHHCKVQRQMIASSAILNTFECKVYSSSGRRLDGIFGMLLRAMASARQWSLGFALEGEAMKKHKARIDKVIALAGQSH